MSTSDHDTAFKLIGIDTDHEFNHGRFILVRQLVDSVLDPLSLATQQRATDWNDGSKDLEIEVKFKLTGDQKSNLKRLPHALRLQGDPR